MKLLQKTFAASTVAAIGYLGYVAQTWLRYGKHEGLPADFNQQTSPLDPFIPAYEVGECHEVQVNTSTDLAFGAINFDVWKRLRLIDLIFKVRELIIGKGEIKRPDIKEMPSDLVEGMKSVGWSVLSFVPGREAVFGAAAQPWDANGKFLPVPPEQFLDYHEPKMVKIVFGMQAVPLTSETCLLRTLTRVQCTDADARRKFRIYWAFLSPGIYLIRRILLKAAKREAEKNQSPLAHAA